MKFKIEKKRIGIHTYYVTQLDALRGRREIVRLAKVIGPALSVADKGEEAALAKLVEALSVDEFDHFCEVLSEQTVVTGGAHGELEPQLSDVFAEHFAGNYLEMVQWLAFALGVNFGSFFAGAVEKIAQQAKKGARSNTASTSPTESTGTSGES
jgi:hypothetical protein